MKKLYYGVRDNGDGSSSVFWVHESSLEFVLDYMERVPEQYYGNDGELSHITIPDHMTHNDLGISSWSFLDPSNN